MMNALPGPSDGVPTSASVPDTARDQREAPEVQYVTEALNDVQHNWDQLLPSQERSPARYRRRDGPCSSMGRALYRHRLQPTATHRPRLDSSLQYPQCDRPEHVNLILPNCASLQCVVTMQLVRDLYLDKDKKWKRKIAEAMMTIHLEREWSTNLVGAPRTMFIAAGAGFALPAAPLGQPITRERRLPAPESAPQADV
jgi:hypothetical protein